MNAEDAAFFAGKSVLVTGHTGFKGSWLTRWLQLLGARVSGFALAPDTRPSLFELARIADGMTSRLGDIRDAGALESVIDEQRPEVVLHLAAQALVRRSYRSPVETFATNVMGTVHLLDACRRSPTVRAIVVVTSDKCYENREWTRGYREDDPLGGSDPYSASKGAAELVTAAYRRSFYSAPGSAGVASVRAGNVIGGGDWAEDRLLPDIVRSAKSGSEVVIRNPASTRPWQHVLDPLSGYLRLARLLHDQPARFAQGYNLGPDAAAVLNVGEVARRFVAALGAGTLVASPPDPLAPHEAGRLALDCARAQAELAWRPRMNLDTALATTAAWYRAHLEAPGAERRLLDEQITAYMSDAA